MATSIAPLIEVRPNNLFANGYLVHFPKDGEGMFIRDKYQFIPESQDRYHKVVSGDRLEMIAYNAYSGQVNDASKYWGIIADTNDIFNPFDLSEFVGKELRIPDISKLVLSL